MQKAHIIRTLRIYIVDNRYNTSRALIKLSISKQALQMEFHLNRVLLKQSERPINNKTKALRSKLRAKTLFRVLKDVQKRSSYPKAT